MYLLDTETIIYSLKGAKAVQKKLRVHLHDPLKISVITLMELYYGAYKSQQVTGNLAKIKALESSFDLVPPGPEVVEIVGMLKAKLEMEGNRLDDFDLIIAATALTHNLVLVTNNVKHFQRVPGLNVTNWCK